MFRFVPEEHDGDRNGYTDDVINGKVALGAPIYFFFELGTDNLVEITCIVYSIHVHRILERSLGFILVFGFRKLK